MPRKRAKIAQTLSEAMENEAAAAIFLKIEAKGGGIWAKQERDKKKENKLRERRR